MVDLTSCEIHIESAFVVLCLIVQTKLPTDFFYGRLDLLHMVLGMISLPHDHV